MSLTSEVQGSVTITDNIVGNVPLTKLLAVLNPNLTNYEYLSDVSIDSGAASSVTFPFGVQSLQLVYICNTGDTNDVVVTWTPHGGTAVTVIQLTPGSVLLLSESDSSNGVDSLSLQAVDAPTTVDLVYGG